MFKLVTRINCWAHVIRNIDDRLKGIEPKKRAAIRADLLLIQLSFNENVFRTSIKLFIAKYCAFTELIKYLNICFSQNTGWYEGFSTGLPSTSNNIESFYLNSIKAKGKMNQRLPTVHF